MKGLVNRMFSLVLFFASTTAVFAQVDMATGMRQSGKIYVVVGTVLLIFAGIIAFLFLIERKINKLEKQVGEK